MVGLHEGLAGTYLKNNIVYNLITITFYFWNYVFNFTVESQYPLEKEQTDVRSPVLKKNIQLPIKEGKPSISAVQIWKCLSKMRIVVLLSENHFENM